MRIASRGRLPPARSALIALPYFFNRRRNVLVAAVARRWITATTFGCDINALFENVRTLLIAM